MVVLSGCANYNLHLQKSQESWQERSPDPDLKITHTMYLIGDAGHNKPDMTPPALKLLRKQLEEASKKSSVVFLGNNIWPNGMAQKKKLEERAEDEARLKTQLDVAKNFKGKVFVIPGNRDWRKYGVKGLKREANFIEEYLDRDDVMLPDPRCAGPVEIELSENLILILVDSQWWLTDWDGETEINDGCDAKSRDGFIALFEEALKSNRTKNVVIAMHHPPYSFGPHGGQYTFRQHIFPFTDLQKGLYLPLPVVGSLYPFLRGAIGGQQDLASPHYKEMTTKMVNTARGIGRFIFASGHENSLQYIEQKGQAFIVSGAGTKRSATSAGEGAEFTYGNYGFSRLIFYSDGSSWVEFWSPIGDGSEGKLVFRKQVKGPLERIAEPEQTSFPPLKDSIKTKLSDYDFGRSRFGEFVWGKHYREAYAAEVDVPILDLNTYKGGVKPIKQGGGFQTNSLRLGGKDGKEYTMRSIDKDPSRTLPYPFNKSFILGILKDFFSSSHPLGALVIPKLAEAAGVYHANPKLYYIPPQANLDNFNDDFANALYLVEERPDEDVWSDASYFGNSKEIISTSDMLEEIRTEQDKKVDGKWLIRSRLFDIMIGDWDRHDDQWRWAEFEEGDTKIYRAIPRDRDQAFSQYDGLVLDLGRQVAPFARQMRPYTSPVKKPHWLNYNGRKVDQTFLTELQWKDWETAALYIQENVTDEVIENAFKDFPQPIYSLDGPQIIEALKSRRADLVNIARKFYLFLAKNVDVVGTSKRERFEVERLDDDHTRVSMYDVTKEGEKKRLMYQRTFLTSETKVVNLYGLDNDDIFYLSGNVNKGIKIRIIGGLEEDEVYDESKVSGLSKKTVVYDAKDEENKITSVGEVRKRLTNNPVLNTYDRGSKDYEYDYGLIYPFFNVNPDDGFMLGFIGQFTTYGFKKSPYSTSHSYSGVYAIATKGILFNYEGQYINLFGDWDMRLELDVQTPLYSSNFYGFGNETVNREEEEEEEDDFYRVKQGLFRIAPALMRKLPGSSFYSIGPVFESIEVDRTSGRFIDLVGDGLNPDIFEGIRFLGLQMILEYQNLDDVVLPSRGIGVKIDAGWKMQLQNTNKNYGFINASVSAYQRIDPKAYLVFGTRIGVQHRITENFEFYQSAVLGGTGADANIRGFRRDRFSGQTAFFQNTDLRWKLFSSGNGVLPFTIGLLGGFDYGRVWIDEEDSNVWHYSYGGGLFIAPLDTINLSFSLFKGDGEIGRFAFTGRFFF
ncbi:MAG: hypothetical protein DHS20C18_53670 [Saprospiraceae bacterium]|nr:MAG: hypothetical protein DHS20C18_53670 [Saprospiraceae bacterium]